jgi:hypothetical protein
MDEKQKNQKSSDQKNDVISLKDFTRELLPNIIKAKFILIISGLILLVIPIWPKPKCYLTFADKLSLLWNDPQKYLDVIWCWILGIGCISSLFIPTRQPLGQTLFWFISFVLVILIDISCFYFIFGLKEFGFWTGSGPIWPFILLLAVSLGGFAFLIRSPKSHKVEVETFPGKEVIEEDLKSFPNPKYYETESGTCSQCLYLARKGGFFDNFMCVKSGNNIDDTLKFTCPSFKRKQ